MWWAGYDRMISREFGDFCMDFHISCRVLLMRWVVNRLRWWRMDFNCLKGSVKILFNLGEFGIFNSSQTLRQILCKHFRFDCKLTQKVNIHPEKDTKVTFTWTISRQLWRILSLHPTPTSHAFRFCRLNTVCLRICNSALFVCLQYWRLQSHGTLIWVHIVGKNDKLRFFFTAKSGRYFLFAELQDWLSQEKVWDVSILVFHVQTWNAIWETYSKRRLVTPTDGLGGNPLQNDRNIQV